MKTTFAARLCAGLLLFGGLPAAAQGGSEALNALFEDEWSVRLKENPLLASRSGVADYNDRLPSVAVADFDRRLKLTKGFLARLHKIDRDSLGPAAQLNFDLFHHVLSHRAQSAPFKAYRIPILADSGFHMDIQRMGEGVPMDSVADFEAYIARLGAIPAYFGQNIANMAQGIKDGFTLPREILKEMEFSISAPIVKNPEDSVYYAPFKDMPGAIPEAERGRLRKAGAEVIAASVIPAYARFLEFFRQEYLPGGRKTLGAFDLPDGEKYYRYLVRYYTTLKDATPEAIHKLGLEEVARIRSEMEAIIAEVNFAGDFAAFIEFLRTDPQFYAPTGEQLLKEAAWIAKQVDGKLPAFFGRLPRLPYGIKPVPESIAPNYTTGRYWGAPIGGRTGGYYLVNTYAVDKRPLYVLPSLTLHEAVPGHHLQTALGQELENVPAFRRNLYPHAFGEGWGLYAEKLGMEMGIYDTPYKQFGRLTYEMWRACRLVIDTGIHAMGWSRQRARDYLAGNTALALHNVQTEVDRYIAWPGQALAYKMGELTILRLRAKATDALGAAFDLRAFHDTVLGAGGIPLNILEQRVDAYISAARP